MRNIMLIYLLLTGPGIYFDYFRYLSLFSYEYILDITQFTVPVLVAFILILVDVVDNLTWTYGTGGI